MGLQTTFPNPLPVFVYGALRSGTTVFRLMLDNHPQIGNPGEVDYIFDFLEADSTHPTGWRYDLEGLVLNRGFQTSGLQIETGPDGTEMSGLDLLAAFLWQFRSQLAEGQRIFTLNVHRSLGKILEIFPDARILHMLRDPRDVARSSIGMGWANHIYRGIDYWIETERDWDRVAPQLTSAHVMTLHYEDLFTDIEGELARVCTFLGVPWEPRMLAYHETSTYAPPDPTLIRQWVRKCDPDHVALLEGKAGELIAARGYELTGTARQPGALERLKLKVQHKSGVWRFGMRRHGAVTYFGEKLSRWMGFSKLHARFRDQMNQNEIATLK